VESSSRFCGDVAAAAVVVVLDIHGNIPHLCIIQPNLKLALLFRFHTTHNNNNNRSSSNNAQRTA